MDLEALLRSHGEDAPSGPNLEYDPAFTEMEIAAQRGEERQIGDEILPASDPDYKEVTEKALSVLERSHDLRAAIYQAEAMLQLDGLPGFAEATSYVRRCLEDYWDTCHPQLDADDDNDPTMRINAVLAIADGDRILRGIRRAPLTASRTFGAYSLRDIAVADGDIAASADMEDVADMSSISAAFKDTAEEHLRKLYDAADSALSDIRAITAKFDAETPGQGPDLDSLSRLLGEARSRLSDALGGTEKAPEPGSAKAEDTAPAPVSRGGSGGGSVGGINSPVDVQNALDRIIAYYQRAEPSSPVPILLARAKRLVNADFLSIIKDMAPDGVDRVFLIGGIEEEDDD
ncbi:type VI secretion system protein TssA [Ostreiculturibacter nitratireducens]|uniref:type VI secretion system protein TssA n=1 Tax=Ostreiculturibacter nitratireducens TaxID=3075226 RepID=UPI0031B5A288